MRKCATCGKELENLKQCQYCKNFYCEEDYDAHMTWERRHAGLAEDEGTLWRKRRDSPS